MTGSTPTRNENPQEPESGRPGITNEERDTMERRELSGPGWTPRQSALYDALEQVAEVFGPFGTGTGPDGIHYIPEGENPFAAEGIRCGGCAFFRGGGGCELVSADVRVHPDAACKFWIVQGEDLSPADPAEPVEASPDAAGYGMKEEDEERAIVTAAPFAGPALVALIGPPGSGKSTWVRSELPDAERVSLEAIRTDEDADRGEVIREAIAQTFALLRAGKLVVFDSTLSSPAFRKRIRGIGRILGVPVHAVMFRTPLDDLIAAQDDREAPVPVDRVREMHEDYLAQYASIPGEGWASVTTISRDDSQERSRSVEFAELRDRLAGEVRSLDVAVTEARAIPSEDGGYVIEGHAAVFDSSSYPLPDGRGSYFIEQVKRGAFRGALQNPESPTVALINHDPNLILASTGSAPPTLELWEDPKGLRIRARVAPTTYAQDLRLLMERGDVSGMSFGFTVEADKWWQDGEGRTRRDIQRIGRLTDISVVVSPAYPEPSSGITSRGADEPHEEAPTASDIATGGPPAAASASTRRRRLDLIERETARNPIRKES